MQLSMQQCVLSTYACACARPHALMLAVPPPHPPACGTTPCHSCTPPPVPVPKTKICEKTLSDDDVADFSQAILRQYWFELFMDDLPMWGYVGEVKRAVKGPDAMLIYPHWQLDISYNGDRVRGTIGVACEGSVSFGWFLQPRRWAASSATQACVHIAAGGLQNGGESGGFRQLLLVATNPGAAAQPRGLLLCGLQQAAKGASSCFVGMWHAILVPHAYAVQPNLQASVAMTKAIVELTYECHVWFPARPLCSKNRLPCPRSARGSLGMEGCPVLSQAQQTIHNCPSTPPSHPSHPCTPHAPQVIHVNLTQHDNETEPVPVESGAKVTFTYAVTWTPTDTKFARRFEKYLDYSFFEHKVGGRCWRAGRQRGLAAIQCAARRTWQL